VVQQNREHGRPPVAPFGSHRLKGGHARLAGWKRAAVWRIFLAMEAFIKIALLAALVVLTFGVIPDRRKGAVIGIGTCVAAAIVLHFVAP